MWHAIDLETIKKRVMRDKSRKTGTLVAPPVPGYAKDNDNPLAYDPDKAKKLLAGGRLSERLQGQARTARTTATSTTSRPASPSPRCGPKVGIQAELQTESRATYFPRQDRGEIDVSMVGWATLPPMDGFSVLSASLLAEQKDGYGGSNAEHLQQPEDRGADPQGCRRARRDQAPGHARRRRSRSRRTRWRTSRSTSSPWPGPSATASTFRSSRTNMSACGSPPSSELAAGARGPLVR